MIGIDSEIANLTGIAGGRGYSNTPEILGVQLSDQPIGDIEQRREVVNNPLLRRLPR